MGPRKSPLCAASGYRTSTRQVKSGAIPALIDRVALNRRHAVRYLLIHAPSRHSHGGMRCLLCISSLSACLFPRRIADPCSAQAYRQSRGRQPVDVWKNRKVSFLLIVAEQSLTRFVPFTLPWAEQIVSSLPLHVVYHIDVYLSA